MSLAADRSCFADRDVTVLCTSLTKWYDAHASVRRLWAIEEGSVLTVYVSLEPSSDGDDALPVWLAMKHKWSSDLAYMLPREIELRFAAADVLSPSCLSGNAAVIADVNWRESWSFS